MRELRVELRACRVRHPQNDALGVEHGGRVLKQRLHVAAVDDAREIDAELRGIAQVDVARRGCGRLMPPW